MPLTARIFIELFPFLFFTLVDLLRNVYWNVLIATILMHLGEILHAHARGFTKMNQRCSQLMKFNQFTLDLNARGLLSIFPGSTFHG